MMLTGVRVTAVVPPSLAGRLRQYRTDPGAAAGEGAESAAAGAGPSLLQQAGMGSGWADGSDAGWTEDASGASGSSWWDASEHAGVEGNGNGSGQGGRSSKPKGGVAAGMGS